MSDHIDGPRTTGDPAADSTDLFAFQSPARPDHIVIVADVFPFCTANTFFSNAVDYAVMMRRVRLVGTGDKVRFQPAKEEMRFAFSFNLLEAQPDGGTPRQRGICTLPDGRKLEVIVGDEKGVSTADGVYRIFAGARSDYFIFGWGFLPESTALPLAVPNQVQGNNCLSLIIEMDTAKALAPERGALFGVVAETAAKPTTGVFGLPGHRIDWIGRPEVTNFHLGVPGSGIDIKDLWNQETPFNVSPERMPMYVKRMLFALDYWDKKDGKRDFTEAQRRTWADILLNDFLLIDVTKPTTNDSYLEIERSAVAGKPYATGGGRTLEANVMDIFISYEINRGDGPAIHGGAQAPTHPGGKTFPYSAPPNVKPLTMSRSVDLGASSAEVWATLHRFESIREWNPLVASLETIGSGVGQLRKMRAVDGGEIIERLDAVDDTRKTVRYTALSGIPAAEYVGTMEVKDRGAGSTVDWSVRFFPRGTPLPFVDLTIKALLTSGLDGLKRKFGGVP